MVNNIPKNIKNFHFSLSPFTFYYVASSFDLLMFIYFCFKENPFSVENENPNEGGM